jgi:enoyl-CoA hydratase/carnithine racemase
MSEIHLSVEEGIARLDLDRPSRRNALSISMLQALDEALRWIAHDESARVVILGGRGPVFCSGHDLSEMVGRSEAEYRSLFELCTKVMLGLRRLPQPVIARVHGAAYAAGCQLVAACDLAVASDTATFATPGVKIGLFCTTPMIPLARAIPAKPALEMLLTGHVISAQQAQAWGLINRAVEADWLDDAVMELAKPILDASPLTIRLGKEAFYRQLSLGEPDAYGVAVEVMTANACKKDAQEGMGAFLEKRPPKWVGA